jgi:hypothetical protein
LTAEVLLDVTVSSIRTAGRLVVEGQTWTKTVG